METWRLINDPAMDGAGNMAVDEALLRCARGGDERAPTLRLYSWDRPTISVGYMQDSTPFAGLGLPVVRRITGGRAVLHDMEITYSVVAGAGTPLFAGGISAAYAIISRCIIAALADAGVPAEFAPADRARTGAATGARDRGACFYAPSRCEVLAGGRKLVGSAQRRFKDVFLQHGSILLGIDPELSSRVFGPGLLKKMTSVGEFSEVGPEVFKGFLIKKLSEGLTCSFSKERLSGREQALKEELLAGRYSLEAWNISRGRPGDRGGAVSGPDPLNAPDPARPAS